jgi:glycine/D-amino acid oxidase-like deaminating enzyme
MERVVIVGAGTFGVSPAWWSTRRRVEVVALKERPWAGSRR